jgi:hypothetical protein
MRTLNGGGETNGGYIDLNGAGGGHKKKRQSNGGGGGAVINEYHSCEQRQLVAQTLGRSHRERNSAASAAASGKRTRNGGIVKSPTELWLV